MKDFNTNTINNDEWLTPPELIKSLGEFDLDPCSPVNRPWDTAKNHFTELDNGLLQDWKNYRVWLNPPYGRALDAWLNRMAMHSNGIALIFARTETKAFHDFIFPYAYSIMFIQGRIQFYDVFGNKGANANAPSILVSYTEIDSEKIDVSGIKGFHQFMGQHVFIIGLHSDNRSWKIIVGQALAALQKESTLEEIYDTVIRLAPLKVNKNKFFHEKIRQQLQLYFKSVERGIWANN